MHNFSTPHCHIQSLDTGSTPESFVERELELGTGTITCTDHGTLAVTRQVYDLATNPKARKSKKLQKEGKLTPIIGLEAYFRDDQCPILTAAGIPKTIHEDYKEAGESFIEYNKYYHLTMHFRDAQAFETASRLLSRAHETAEKHGSEYKPIFNWADLEEIGGTNTVVTSGCLIGMAQRHLLADRPDLARKYYEHLRSIVRPGNFFVEVFPHRCSHNWMEAVFLYGPPKENGEPPDRLRFNPKKTLRVVTLKGDVHEGHARDLLKKLANEQGPMKLVAVSHYRSWQESDPYTGRALPFDFVKWEHVEDYVQNECKPWAPDGDAQIGGNRFMLDLAREFGDPVLISDDSHFAHPDDKVVQDVRLRQSGSWRFYSSYHRQSSEEAFAYFKDALGTTEAEFERWIEYSREWASRFKDFKFKDRKTLPVSFYPKETLKHTIELVKSKGRMRWEDPKYVARLRAEINLLHKNGTIDLLPYFMIDEEVCTLYEKNNRLTGPGRGSAAGLLLTYLLGITHVDPLRFDLSMDRFMTPDRIKSGKLPDIDQDLPTRDLLVGEDGASGWLKERFGDHYAQISTDTSMKVKSAIKDVYRARHGDVPSEIHRICKRLPDAPQGISDYDFVFGYVGADEERVPGILETDLTLQSFVQQYPSEWSVVVKCLGLVRQKSRHACAYVIADEPVPNFLPTTLIGGVRCTEYTAPSVEAAGGLKMDFLVVTSLNDIEACIRLIQQRHGAGLGQGANKDEFLGHDFFIDGLRVPGLRVVPWQGKLYDIYLLPEDQSVFRMICEQDTETIFQFNTPGAKKWLRHFNYEVPDKPGHKAIDSIEALSAFTALDRPGPLDAYVGEGDKQHNMLVEFAIRARGGDATGNIEVLDQMLPETYGVITYQEQLQRVFQTIAGTDGIVANAFREHVSKKKMADVIKDREIFFPAAKDKYGESLAETLWGQLFTFGQYGFNRSHAVCYTFIGYACGWLKRHYPLEWWCSVLRNAERNEINHVFWKHCGGLIDLPDIKHSGRYFEIQNGRIRAPLSLLQGIGPTAHQEIVEEGPYTDIDDFCQKIEARRVRRGEPVIVRKEKKVKDPVTKEKSVVVTETPGVKKARSALNKGIMAKLIISGAADGLFPPVEDPETKQPREMTMLEKLSAYEYARAKAQDKHRRDGSVKAEPVDPKYLDVNQYIRFQMRKEILPGYSENILPMFLDRRVEGIKREGNRLPTYLTQVKERGPYGGMVWVDYEVPFSTARHLEHLNRLPVLPKKQVVALAAYVSTYRQFTYQENTKTAAELVLDVNGTQLKFVRWPEKDGKLPAEFKEDLTGALVIATVTKWQVDRDATLDNLMVVQPPLKKDEKAAEESAA